MKKILLLSVVALSACSLGFLKYDSLPVVKATVKQGANLASVTSAGGAPERQTMLPNKNIKCLDYTLRIDDSSMPFFVSFNREGRVTSYGYVTCESAIREGYSIPDTPMKQRY